jgi:GntR family transcriptional repressor for pyruvate dehydrogenase complex
MMPLAQTSPRAVDVAIESLERMTLDRLRPGDVLPSEGQLAQTLSVSRLTIREAVRVLEARGLLDLRKGRRAVVRAQNGVLAGEYFRIAVRSDPRALFDLLEVRVALEVHCATLAAQRASSATCAPIAQAMQGMLSSSDAAAFHDADVRFHEAVAAASGNSMLAQLIEGLAEPLRLSRQHSYRGRTNEGRGLEPVIQHHQAILDAVMHRDPAAAATAMRRHLRAAEHDLRASLDPRTPGRRR